uniref:Uncharacterized protein n=1 Tax=Chaetoceros debilis TaxID=122233 RepID=A0A7S3QJL0_9STRA|mmetsp:Transcript_6610/g.9671  ORF Transcript_6610/g.9671 Transcript_6610/m.9671 type:complete len:692 (+) Transcript_6610:265-2340(+)
MFSSIIGTNDDDDDHDSVIQMVDSSMSRPLLSFAEDSRCSTPSPTASLVQNAISYTAPSVSEQLDTSRASNTSTIYSAPNLLNGEEQLVAVRQGNQRLLPLTATTTTVAPVQDCIFMFVAAGGCTLCITAILSNLVYYTAVMGMESYFLLNLVLYAPMLPITIFQTLYDGKFDQWIGDSHLTYTFRGIFGYIFLILGTGMVPSVSRNENQLFALSLVSLVIGLASAVLHGILKQMASFIYPQCGRLAAAAAAGMQASALAVLVMSYLSGFGDGSSTQGMRFFYYSIVAMVVVSGGCYWRLLYECAGVSQSMQRKDSYYQLSNIGDGDGDRDSDEISGEEERKLGNGDGEERGASSGLESLLLDQNVNVEILQERDGLTLTSTSPLRTGSFESDHDDYREHEHEREGQESEQADYGHYDAIEGTPQYQQQRYQQQQQQQSPQGMASYISRSSPARQQQQQQPVQSITSPSPNILLSTWELWEKTRPACLVLMITVASSMSVAAWFNRVQSQYYNPNSNINGADVGVSTYSHENFPQILFYTRLVGDLLGRPATLCVCLPQGNRKDKIKLFMSTLITFTVMRLIFVPIFFLYAAENSIIPKNDMAAIGGVFAFAFTSGFFATLSYQMAPLLLSMDDNEEKEGVGSGPMYLPHDDLEARMSNPNLDRQTGLINVCFSMSILMGFALTFLVDTLG